MKKTESIGPMLPEVKNKYFGVTENTRTGRYFIKELPGSNGDPLYYRKMLEVIQNSSTAQIALERMHSFIVADGFVDETFSDVQMNLFQKADDLLSEIAYDWVYHKGIAMAYKPAVANGGVMELSALEFSRIIRTKTKSFIINPKYPDESGYKKENDREFLAWDSRYTTAEIKKEYTRQLEEYGSYTGYLIYEFIPKPNQKIYPIPPFYAAEYEMRVEFEYARREYNVTRNSFKPDMIIETPELNTRNEIDNEGNELYGTSEYDDFTRQVRKASEPGAIGGVIHVQRKTNSASGKEIGTNVINLNPFQGAEDLGLRQDNAAFRIARAVGTPPVLCGLKGQSGIGDTKQIADEIQLFNDTLNKDQRFLSNVFSKLFPDMDTTLSTHNPLNYIPDSMLFDLTQNERRNLIGYPPIDEPTNNTADGSSN